MVVALWIALLAGVSLESDSACPAPATVLRELARLLPSDAPGDRALNATVTHAGAELTLELRGPEGTLLAQRTLSVAGASCAEQAQTLAVLLATWEGEIESRRSEVPSLGAKASGRLGAISALPESPAPLVPAGPVERADAGGAAPLPRADAGPDAVPRGPAGEAPDQPRAASAAEVASAPRPVLLPRERARPSTWSLGVGGGPLATVANGQLAFGGLARAALRPVEAPWFLAAELSGLGQHSQPLGEGTALWSRLSLGLGGGGRLRWRWLELEAYALLDGAWIQLSGQGFTPDSPSTSDLDLGVSAALRLAVPLGRVRPFAELRADAWLRGQQVEALPSTGAQKLPMMELIPALGVDFELL